MAIPNSRASARALVQKITNDIGYVEPGLLDRLEALDPELRRLIEVRFRAKDRALGSAVITLAKNLYTSKARFVFELLQNADDNAYSRAIALGDIPYVTFRVYPRRIVFECNEDGFTDKNLTAICAIGTSSKTGAQGYIGEKGIGFKSVFMAASKVHIQSGALSFSFRHEIGDLGIGMITPIWEETNEELPSPLTRFTLYLHEHGDAEMLAKTRESIQTQFEELQANILLFMKNLKKIQVISYDETSEQTSSTTYSVERPHATCAVLKKTKITKFVTQNDVKRFHVTTHEATNLAKNENRTYSEIEESSCAYAKSLVVLAFPLSEGQTPDVEPQDLFVFLPVRPVGFNFLIQADFVTDANRQDVVQDSLRNSRLIDSVADAFIKAILQFCEHDTLRFRWMRYLPDKDSKEWRGLWLSLVNAIAKRLAETPVLYGREKSGPRLIADLCRLSWDVVDENDDPLFHDESPGKLVSQHYSMSDLDRLTEYGLRHVTYDDVMEWVTKDLKRGGLSRIRSPMASEDWHTRVAKLLNKPFDKNWVNIVTVLQKLELIPLEDGTWVSAEGKPVYLPKVGELEIPSHIDLRLLAKRVVLNERKLLFQNLGVKTATISQVRDSIFRFYGEKEPNLETSKHHLEFLYLTRDKAIESQKLYDIIKLHTQAGEVLNPRKSYMYIANNDPNGPWELFRAKEPGPNPGDGAPGFSAFFLHEEYFKNAPGGSQDRSWIEWFYNKLDVERHVRLEVATRAQNYIQTHRPEKFLGAIYEWYKHNSRLTPRFDESVWDTNVLCRGNHKVPLREASFPTTDLVKRTDRYLGQDVVFPWLQLEFETTPDNIPPRWKSLLSLLKVAVSQTDVEFALKMLNYLLKAFPSSVAASDTTRLFELYDHIHERYWESEHRTDAKQKINTMFSQRKCIYIPRPQSGCTWAFPNECVWNAPQDMTTKFVLKRLYRTCFCKDGAKCPHFSKFFVETLGVSAACTWSNYVEELKALKNVDCEDVDTITGIYKAINALQPKNTDSDALRESFEKDALIYAMVEGQPSWHKPSQCVWSKAAKLRGRVSLNEDYEDLEELFTLVFGVKQVDLLMAIDELEHIASRQSASVSDVKESIWAVNSLLSTETNLPEPSRILESSIFPIRYPDSSVRCGTAAPEFFIVDREQLRQYFAAKVKLLDFTLEEVVRLRPFIHWTCLQSRYLSYCTKEVTSFPGEGASPISYPDRQIRHRAYPFLRIACHFNSPRLKSSRDVYTLYQVLKESEVFETDGISSILQILQDGRLWEVESSRTTLCIKEDDSGLKIYVPRNKDDQRYIFTNSLSQKLFLWMMTNPTTQISEFIDKDGEKATRDVLLTPYSKLSTALEDNGIATIDIENTDEAESGTIQIPDPESELQLTPVGDDFRNLDISDRDETEHDESDIPGSDAESMDFIDHSVVASRRVTSYRLVRPIPRVGSPQRQRIESSAFELPTPTRDRVTDHHYVNTLDRVITAGRQGTLPAYGALVRPNSGCNVAELGLRSPSQIERDCKVGAAGELYVFELLSHLSEPHGLPAFARHNWKSNVRKYVTVHPEYADMEEWHGRETSDITYWDVQSALTCELIEKGFLARNVWEGKRPNYFIEVKTTTGACDTPFYMSKAQYQRMQDNILAAGNTGSIYAIFRVYWLGQDSLGLKIYLDPESLRLSGQLKFKAESWSVVPGECQNDV